MKTQGSISRKFQLVMAITILISALLFLASCQKEETVAPANASTNADSQRLLNNQTSGYAFTSIVINHVAMETGEADYSIAVSSDGTVKYNGRQNVNVKGEKSWKASSGTLYSINKLFVVFISEMNRNSAAAANRVPIESYVETKYNMAHNKQTISLIDFNTGDPASLFKFRTLIEKELNISWLVNGRKISFAQQNDNR